MMYGQTDTETHKKKTNRFTDRQTGRLTEPDRDKTKRGKGTDKGKERRREGDEEILEEREEGKRGKRE